MPSEVWANDPQSSAQGRSLRGHRDLWLQPILPLQTQPPLSPTTLRSGPPTPPQSELFPQPSLLRPPSDPPLSTALLSSPSLPPAGTSFPKTLLIWACWKMGHLWPIYGWPSGEEAGR